MTQKGWIAKNVRTELKKLNPKPKNVGYNSYKNTLKTCTACGKEELMFKVNQIFCHTCILKAKAIRWKNTHCFICGRLSRGSRTIIDGKNYCSFCLQRKAYDIYSIKRDKKRVRMVHCDHCDGKIWKKIKEKYNGLCIACYELQQSGLLNVGER